LVEGSRGTAGVDNLNFQVYRLGAYDGTVRDTRTFPDFTTSDLPHEPTPGAAWCRRPDAGPAVARCLPTATAALTKEKMLADKATRSTGELSDYAEKLLIVRGVNLPYSSTGCSHSAADAQILTSATRDTVS